MTVDTKGLVETPVKDVLHVMSIIEATLREYVRSKMPAERPRFGLAEGYHFPTITLNTSGTLWVTFAIAGVRRALFIAFSCDCDNQEAHPGKKLKLSLGHSNGSVEIMSAVLAKLTHLGTCFILEADVDDRPYVKVDAATMTFIDTVVQGYNTALNVDDWVRAHAALPKKGTKPLAEFLGITADELKAFNADSSTIFDICDEYVAAAKALSAVETTDA